VPRRVSLFVTCLVDLFYPEVGQAVVQVLEAQAVTVDVPDGQTCCGLPLLNSGYRAEATRIARRTLSLFVDADRVVVPSGSCAWMVRNEYPRLFVAEPATHAQAVALGRKVFEFSEFLARTPRPATVPARLPGGTVTYHDSCHLLRGLGVSREPRELIRRIDGARFVEMVSSDRCCGFGGSFAVTLPEVSNAMLGEKMRQIEATAAEIVIANDCGCLMQIRGGLARRSSGVRALHLAQVLAGQAGS
jgi:L-lactate dehydrogenase complex protein LldE